MVAEIEYYKGDVWLYGPALPFDAFKEQMRAVERLYDRDTDNFIPLLCRMYSWKVCDEPAQPQYVYDRDIQRCQRVRQAGV